MGPGNHPQAPRAHAFRALGERTRNAGWYPRAKATKPKETNGEESERFVVPGKRGNDP